MNSLEQNVQALMTKLPGMIYRCRADELWTMEYITPGCKALTGYSPEQLIGNALVSFGDLIYEGDRQRLADIVAIALGQRRPFSVEYRITAQNYEQKWVWEQGVGVFDEADELLFIEGFVTDITAQKDEQNRLASAVEGYEEERLHNISLLNEYRKAVDAAAMVTKTNAKGVITYVNKEFCRTSGYQAEELLGKTHNVIRHPKNTNAFYNELWSTISNKKIWKGVILNRRKNKESYYEKTVIVPILDHRGEIEEYIAIRNDVTDLIHQAKRIKEQTTDQLTSLPNRQKLLESLQENDDLKLGILNVESFKEVNEYYGFDVGDSLLIEIASTLHTLLVHTNIKVYKLPGDEFALLDRDRTPIEKFLELTTVILNKINAKYFEIGDHSIHIRMVAGISAKPNYFVNAEMACNHAKESGKLLTFFDNNKSIEERLIHNIKWTRKLKKAIAEDRMVIFTQPIFDSRCSPAEKFECLIRMIDEDGSTVSPGVFLNIAKKSRLHHELTRIVVTKAVAHFEKNQHTFSINLSIEDILNEETAALLESKLKNNRSLGERVILEIVEDEGIEKCEEVTFFIERMKKLGCKIAIDDFGTGYSNFDYLMRLDVDYIKIDGSIIKNIDHDVNARIVTELIVSFAKRLGMKTIGEFVHSKSVLDSLRSMDVDFAQGFHLGKPESLKASGERIKIALQ